MADYWIVINNSENPFNLIAQGLKSNEKEIIEENIWKQLKKISDEE